ncbi:MAG: hypothetical protein ACM3JI_02430, partial [Anaerolineae bacterium]
MTSPVSPRNTSLLLAGLEEKKSDTLSSDEEFSDESPLQDLFEMFADSHQKHFSCLTSLLDHLNHFLEYIDPQKTTAVASKKELYLVFAQAIREKNYQILNEYISVFFNKLDPKNPTHHFPLGILLLFQNALRTPNPDLLKLPIYSFNAKPVPNETDAKKTSIICHVVLNNAIQDFISIYDSLANVELPSLVKNVEKGNKFDDYLTQE